MWLGSVPQRGWTCRRAKRAKEVLPEGAASEARRRLPGGGHWRAPQLRKEATAGLGFGGRNCGGGASGFSLEEVRTDVQGEGAEGALLFSWGFG